MYSISCENCPCGSQTHVSNDSHQQIPALVVSPGSTTYTIVRGLHKLPAVHRERTLQRSRTLQTCSVTFSAKNRQVHCQHSALCYYKGHERNEFTVPLYLHKPRPFLENP